VEWSEPIKTLINESSYDDQPTCIFLKDPKQLAKEADIRKLLIATGAGKMGVQAMQQMINSIKIQNPNVPSDYFDKLMEEADPNELIEISIPSYDKNTSKTRV